MPDRLSLGAALLGALLLVGVTRADCVATPTRHVIKFYEYQGAQSGAGAEAFAVFRKVVDEEVGRLSALTAPDEHPADLSTEPAPGPSANYARGQLDPQTSGLILDDPRLLELLDGRLQQHPTHKVYVVHSDIYLPAAPAASTPIEPISEDFLMDPDQYETARSVHLAATYFALATDAGWRSCRPQQVGYLARAQEILRDIRTKGAGAKLLSQRVRAMQQALGLLP